MNRIGQIINAILLFLFSCSSTADLVKFCNKAAPQLGCDTLSVEELTSLRRMCKDTSKTLASWSGYAVGATEKLDRTGAVTLHMNRDKQGSANGRTPCTQFQVYRYPKTEYDVIADVALAKENNWKIKAVGAAHTDNELICGDGMAMSNRFMDKIFEIGTFEGEEIVRAQPGVTIRQLGEWLHQRHKSLGFAVVGFEAVTLGGVIGTGAHGSSLTDTAMLSDIVQSFRIVTADGKVHEITRKTMEQKNHDLWRALGVNLGMMGIVTEVRLRIQDEFQLHVSSKKFKDDRLFVDGQGILSYTNGCDTASFHWFPKRPNSKSQLFRNCGKIVRRGSQPWEAFSKNVDKRAQYILHAPNVPQVYVSVLKSLLHKGACDPSQHFKVELIRRYDLRFHPPYAKKRRIPVHGLSPLASHPKGITGWSFAMQNSIASSQGNEYRQTDWEVAVPAKKSPEVFRFLQDFMNGKDPSYEKPFPLQSVGFFIRFSKASPSLMSHAAIGGDFRPDETVMFLELSEYLPTFDIRNDNDKRIANAIMDEYERPFRVFLTELVKRFGARAHWAKNRQEFFQIQANNPDRQKQISLFARQVKALDPNGLFSNPLREALFVK